MDLAFIALSCCGSGGKPRKASILPSASCCIDTTGDCATQLTSLRGSRPTCAAIMAIKACCPPSSSHAHGLAFQISDRAHPISTEQLKATGMASCQDDNRVTRVHSHDEARIKVHVDVGLTRS